MILISAVNSKTLACCMLQEQLQDMMSEISKLNHCFQTVASTAKQFKKDNDALRQQVRKTDLSHVL